MVGEAKAADFDSTTAPIQYGRGESAVSQPSRQTVRCVKPSPPTVLHTCVYTTFLTLPVVVFVRKNRNCLYIFLNST